MSGALIPMTLAGWAEHEAAGFAEAFAEVERQIEDLSFEDTKVVLAALRKEFERQHDENMGALAMALGTAH
jgi:outer membrane lipoprotein-sorting protein